MDIALAVENSMAGGDGSSDCGCEGGGSSSLGSVAAIADGGNEGEGEHHHHQQQQQERVLYETQGLSGLLGSGAMHFAQRDPVLTCTYVFFWGCMYICVCINICI